MKLLIYDKKNAYAKGINTNATTIIAENCNVTPKLEICSINDENLECTNATGKNDKSISIESNNKPNIAKSNDMTQMVIGLDIAQSEPFNQPKC